MRSADVRFWKNTGHRANLPGMSAYDPKRTFQLFSRDPVRYIVAGCDLAPNDIDVTAQIIDLVREGQRDADMADGMFNSLDLGSRFSQMHVLRIGVERSLQSLELGVPIEQAPARDPIVSQRQKPTNGKPIAIAATSTAIALCAWTDNHKGKCLCMNEGPFL